MKRLPAIFFRTPAGREPVREWLKALEIADRRIVGADIATAEFAWPIGMPKCRAMGQGLFEIRSNLSTGRIARVMFGVTEDRMVLLHGFIKKSQKTPKTDFDLALARWKETKR